MSDDELDERFDDLSEALARLRAAIVKVAATDAVRAFEVATRLAGFLRTAGGDVAALRGQIVTAVRDREGLTMSQVARRFHTSKGRVWQLLQLQPGEKAERESEQD